MDNLRLAIGPPGKIAEGAMVIPCVESLFQLSSLRWNHCPVCGGISVQIGVEYAQKAKISSHCMRAHGRLRRSAFLATPSPEQSY